MISVQNVKWGLRQPALFPVLLRRLFPWKALRHDAECAHLIKSWASGKLPRRTMAQIFPGIEAVDVQLRIPYSRRIGTATDLPELACIVAAMRFLRARNVLEIGTNDGFTTLNLAANLGEHPDATVVTLDLAPEQPRAVAAPLANACDPSLVGSRFRSRPEAARIRQCFGDSTRMDWTALGGPFDVIFIDGGHDRACVASDTRNAFKHLAPGGAIFWHDYGLILDVSDVLDETAKSMPISALVGTRLAVYRDTPRS
jgi:predicted O-methyltransferase YrrM